MDDVAGDIGEAEVAAVVAVGQVEVVYTNTPPYIPLNPSNSHVMVWAIARVSSGHSEVAQIHGAHGVADHR